MQFRCGGIITENIRAIFRYERNNTSGGNGTESDPMTIESKTNSTDQFNSTDDSSNSQIMGKHNVLHEMHTSQMSSQIRIVNGDDCPPGDCPWQVKILPLPDHDFFLFCNNEIPI